MPQDRRCKYCDGKIPEGRRSVFCHDGCKCSYKQGCVSVRPRDTLVPTCLRCDAPFEPTRGKQKYCTKECQHEAWIQKNRTRQDRCGSCGKQFTVSRQFRRACSPECSNAMLAALKHKQAIENFGPPRTCRWCGITFGYSKQAYAGWCSKSCQSEYMKDYRRRLGHERRARQREVTIEVFSPAYILKRDKYVCQACGKKTKPKEKPTHPLYPNVDHIVPLAAGGEHSKKNCRCVCASCNSQKREGTLNDQLLLFG